MSSLLDNIYAECFNPVKIKMFDSIAQQEVVREVPCGKCYHCKITKINEWVTRMVVQSLYSKYVYFGTLTYGVQDSDIFRDTEPLFSRCNSDGLLQPTPVHLCKKHLQDFFKRLRKNTGVKFQYFACGEYGSKYGRPHYHYIMWSNIAISESEVANSWSTVDDYDDRVPIGRIEHQDLRQTAVNFEASYKYVCKYLHKSSFEFNKLVTRDLHEKVINKQYGNNVEDYETIKKQYIKDTRPFVLCSKRPAIGFSYLQEHIGEYAKGNFKLFGVKGNYVFPLYYYRKTKEYLCPFKTISTKNGKPNSYSNIPSVAAMLVELQNAISFQRDFLFNTEIVRFRHPSNTVVFSRKHIGSRGTIELPCDYFNFYDCKNRYYYYLRGDGQYDVCANKHELLYVVPAEVVLNEVQGSYNRLLDAFVRDVYFLGIAKRNSKLERIDAEFETYENYLSERSKVIENLLSIIERKQYNYKLTKTEF